MDEINWAYTIMTVDDSRAENKANIRNYLRKMPEVFLPWVDCRKQKAFSNAKGSNMDLFSLRWENILPGEFGVFLSQMEAWKYATTMPYDGLIILEDDAILNENSYDSIVHVARVLPDDWHSLSLWVPEGHLEEFYYHRYTHKGISMLNWVEGGAKEYLTKHPQLAKAYQMFSCVTTAISPAGGERLLELVHRDAMYTPVDVAWFEWAKAGDLNAYAPTPAYCDIVTYDWTAPSTIRNIEPTEDDWETWF
jgi:GR25 family glycosyltransferase involved in LPS biosynthesis